MCFPCWCVKKQYENALSSDNNVALDEIKPVILFEEEILLQIGMFL